jgi:hypothetical protein
MDKLTRYREVARNLVQEYSKYKPSNGEIDSYPVIDPQGDHYIAMQTGWDHNRRRVQGSFIHLDIITGKIWIQFNGTDRDIAEEMVDAGVAKEDIVLAEKPPHIRQYTGYGVG